jgi:riboflavin synthase
VTALGRLRDGDRVNLERAMRADSRFGGHFVQGHVDATATVEGIRAEGESHWLTVGFPAPLAGLFVPKGSVAVDGISLTIAALAAASFDVMIIPFTWAHTNLPSRRAGDTVNLECDMVGKYVARSVALFGAPPAPDTDTR